MHIIVNVSIDSIVGSGVTLEVLRESHFEEYYKAASDPTIWTFMPFPLCDRDILKLFVAHVAAQPSKGEAAGFVIRDKQSHRLVGGSGYWHIDHQHNKLEIGGSWVIPELQRTRVNTEAKFLLLRHAFEEMGCTRVGFSIDERNTQSITAIERIGATREGLLRSDMAMHDGTLRNSFIYSILASEWPVVKLRLQTFINARA